MREMCYFGLLKRPVYYNHCLSFVNEKRSQTPKDLYSRNVNFTFMSLCDWKCYRGFSNCLDCNVMFNTLSWSETRQNYSLLIYAVMNRNISI